MIPNQMLEMKKLHEARQKIRIIRREAGKSFVTFRRIYFPHYHKVPDASFHLDIATDLDVMARNRGVQMAIAAPRESAKSTLVTLEYVLWCICYGLDKFIVIISSTNDQAVSFLSNVKQELESNTLLMQDFPDVSENGQKPGSPRWAKDVIRTRNGIQVMALGTGQNLRGQKNRQYRPTLIILDDIENNDMINSAEGYQKLVDWVSKAVLKSGSGETNVICVGTIHHYNSFLAQLTSLDAYPGWRKKIYRSIIQWSPNLQDWQAWTQIYNNREQYEGASGPEAAKRYFNERKAAMLDGTQVLWEAKKGYYDLMVMRENDGHWSFDSEMQNEPVNPRDCIFNPADNQYWDDQHKTEEELLSCLGDDVVIVGACDPSLGKSNFTGDYSGIVTIIKHMPTGNMYVLDADIERRKPDVIIETILECHRRRKYSTFAFESNQFQEYAAEMLEKRAKETGGKSLDVRQVQHQKDKGTRIQSLQPMIKNGTIKFSRRHTTLLEQIKFFPKGRHDDGPDALEMAVHLALEASNKIGISWFTQDVWGEWRIHTI